ncbi:unnamed protein product [Zymoseptoria tritici ST99CH_1A5]|uniref:Exonuclease domain-containing protein n=2 Tax=Zymoseptoria tritici TaxID=1047171 RepID=A0A1X7S205_ZYMT9|nr:unnamed protein product [Zymoseptoria tritici ST99CH_3D7]SMR60151.1 unnamed protein product [Zymoseptoria tritici ST99CH_3D1]SMY27344.1 unnamed protein product [Zymoseptoria tritici ST99CH_1A5]
MSITTATSNEVLRGSNGRLQFGAPPKTGATRGLQVEPNWAAIIRFLALDVEFAQVLYNGAHNYKQRPGRVSIVNKAGVVIYDVFVHFDDEPEVLDVTLPDAWRKFGVYDNDILASHGARPIAEVEDYVYYIIRHSTVICHAIKGDWDCFSDWVHDQVPTRDTQQLPEYKQHGKAPQFNPKLSTLAEKVLERVIQKGDHSSVEDAKTTMDLYNLREAEFEATQGSRPCPVKEKSATITAPKTPSVQSKTPTTSPSSIPPSTFWQTGASQLRGGFLTSRPNASLPHAGNQDLRSSHSSTSTGLSRTTTSTSSGSPESSDTPPTELISPMLALASASEPPTPDALAEAIAAIDLVAKPHAHNITKITKTNQGSGEYDEATKPQPIVEATKATSEVALKLMGKVTGVRPSADKPSWARTAAGKAVHTAQPVLSKGISTQVQTAEPPVLKVSWAQVAGRK